MYHRVKNSKFFDQLSVSPARFEMHMAFLKKNYRVISLPSAIKELSGSTSPRPGVVVTFDDGYLDNLSHALPVLKKYQIPATIFITTYFCEQTVRHSRYAAESGRLHLTWKEVDQLLKVPGITIGSHTLSHPYLSRLGNEESWQEISDSRQIIQSRIGLAAQYFCYPSGDYGIREITNVLKAGYTAAVTVTPGVNRLTTPLLELRRTEINDKDDINTLCMKLSGAFDPIHQLIHWKRKWNMAVFRTTDNKDTQFHLDTTTLDKDI
jgi:peptidoglycan/xylan/chitin deacetylase (PgdA/CDA1 family)